MNRNNVVLVDTLDNPLGIMEKILAHEQGKLHRAFSVFVFNEEGSLLLQQRADIKYHGAGLWTNTCCSHPQWGEDVRESAVERLYFEMGLMCSLDFVYSFIYHADVENNLTEHELDYVFTGYSNEKPVLNTNEVKDFKWMDIDDILIDLEVNPTDYSVWFRKALPELLLKIHK